MTKYRTAFPTLLLTLVLAGCGASDPTPALEDVLPLAPEQPTYHFGYPPFESDAFGPRALPEASSDVRREAARAAEMASLAMIDNKPLDEIDGLLRDLFAREDLSLEAAWKNKTTMSVRMLDRLLPPNGPPHPLATPERVSYYVDKLIENNNPNADRILVGLQFLEGHWPESRIEAAAEQAVEAAAPFTEPCETCRSAPPPSLGVGDRRAAIAEGVSGLQSL